MNVCDVYVGHNGVKWQFKNIYFILFKKKDKQRWISLIYISYLYLDHIPLIFHIAMILLEC